MNKKLKALLPTVKRYRANLNRFDLEKVFATEVTISPTFTVAAQYMRDINIHAEMAADMQTGLKEAFLNNTLEALTPEEIRNRLRAVRVGKYIIPDKAIDTIIEYLTKTTSDGAQHYRIVYETVFEGLMPYVNRLSVDRQVTAKTAHIPWYKRLLSSTLKNPPVTLATMSSAQNRSVGELDNVLHSLEQTIEAYGEFTINYTKTLTRMHKVNGSLPSTVAGKLITTTLKTDEEVKGDTAKLLYYITIGNIYHIAMSAAPMMTNRVDRAMLGYAIDMFTVIKAIGTHFTETIGNAHTQLQIGYTG
jgi:hypothetical protein